ncbi:penicillin-binding protein [Sutcliffiella cohnii]|uniref:Penicillin-binding protein n=1 Tax=Sutcliffiella cohnii TaxID=33932 RepID=A0A223KPJ9_9BACI|nr:serine hydrolase domain-containing protein [Sutcliffiella cohnii]AST91258.1 penicillin-binding protein [Sutcliffiella cohnii]
MKKIIMLVGLLVFLFSPLSVLASVDKSEKLRAFLDEAVDQYNIPGASLAIIENGEIIFENNWGALSDGSTITGDTPFLIGSISKPITALATMMLVEEGRIDLEEPIETYLPSFTYKSESPISVRHLLNQTSGISAADGFEITDRASADWTISEAINQLSGVELVSEPGEVYKYNSANYTLLGGIIEAVTNETFSKYIQDHIFSPLQMDDAAADYERAVQKGLVPGYASWWGNPVKSDSLYDHAGAPYGYMSASTNDLVNFLQFMMDGGDLLSEESLALLTTHPGEVGKYGLGWHFSKTEHFPFHGGSTPHFRGELFFLPEQGIGAVLLTNKHHIMEDGNVYYIMDGIRSILNGEEPNLPAPSYLVQWVLLGILLVILLFTISHIIKLFRTKNPNKKLAYTVGSISIVLAAVLIPLFGLFIGTPWRTIKLFAPDIAFLTHCVVGVLGVYGVAAVILISVKSRKQV